MIGTKGSESFIFRNETIFVDGNGLLYAIELGIYEAISSTPLLTEQFKDTVDSEMLRYLHDDARLIRYFSRKQEDFFEFTSVNGKYFSFNELLEHIVDLNDIVHGVIEQRLPVTTFATGLFATIKKGWVSHVVMRASSIFDYNILTQIFAENKKVEIVMDYPDNYDKFTMICFTYAKTCSEEIAKHGVSHFKEKTVVIPITGYNFETTGMGKLAIKYDLHTNDKLIDIDMVSVEPHKFTQLSKTYG